MSAIEFELTTYSAPPIQPNGNIPASWAELTRSLRANTFHPHPWFIGGHKQTLAAYVWPRNHLRDQHLSDEVRYFEIETGTKLLALCRWQPSRTVHPTLILVHGLEGSSDSIYMRSLAVKAFAQGFNVIRLNQRNCGGTEHLTPTLYHSGMSLDFLAVIRELIERDGLQRIYLAGISMSGNMVLQLAGEYAAELPEQLVAVAAISPSVDLKACEAISGRRENFLYRWQFVSSMKNRIRVKARHFPDQFDVTRLSEIKFIKDFDRVYTVEHGGFESVDDYYARCSSRPHVGKIRIPTLVIHAQDDPVVPFAPLADPIFENNDRVILLAPETGGHVGFLARAGGHEDRFWAENRLIEFCTSLEQISSIN